MSADLSTRRCSIYDLLDVVRLQHIPSSLLQRAIATCSDLAIKIVLQKVIQDFRTPSRFHSALQMPRRHAHRTLYVIGGYCRSPGSRWSDSYTLSQVDCYETFTKTWRTAPSLRSARSDACVVSLDGALYAIGGESESLIFDSVERLEPSISNRWNTVEPMTVPRCSAGVCVFGQSVYVFGGWVGYESSSSIEIYDCQNRIWTNGGTIHGERRWGMGVVEYQGLIYLAGGVDEHNRQLCSVDSYNPVTGQWLAIASMQTARSHFGLVALDGYLYAVGGWNDYDGALKAVEKYSVEEDKWIGVSAMSTQRAGVAVAVAGGVIFAVGGRVSNKEFASSETLSSFECYCPENDEWASGGTMPVSRCDAGIVVL